MQTDRDYMVKIGPELAERLKQLARQDRRTVKAELELLLELGLAAYERQQSIA